MLLAVPKGWTGGLSAAAGWRFPGLWPEFCLAHSLPHAGPSSAGFAAAAETGDFLLPPHPFPDLPLWRRGEGNIFDISTLFFLHFVQKAFDVQIICLSWAQNALGGEQTSNDSEVFNESNSAVRHKWTEDQIKILLKAVEEGLSTQVRYASAVAFLGGGVR